MTYPDTALDERLPVHPSHLPEAISDPEPEDVIACTIVGDDEVTDEALDLARRILADLEAAGFIF